MSDTNAVKWLRTQDVPFEVLEYTFTEIGADHAAQAVAYLKGLAGNDVYLVLCDFGQSRWWALTVTPLIDY